MWLPGNRLQASAGREEPIADVLEFIGGVVEDEDAVTAEPKRMAFFRAAPALVDLLQAQGMHWLVSRQPDYLSHPKAKPGRSLDAAVIDGERVGAAIPTAQLAPQLASR
jgi:hypothetical protein